MAKKKKQTRSRARKVEAVETEPSPFWGFAGAILLFVAALFALLGGFLASPACASRLNWTFVRPTEEVWTLR